MLFVDTFNGTFESENALAAARVLRSRRLHRAYLAKDGGHYCCGRTYLSSGMVERAKDKARELIGARRSLCPGRHRDRGAGAILSADLAR